MRLGKHQKHALDFIRQVKGWHSFSQDSLTKRTINSLEKHKLVETNQFQQFRAV